MLDRMRLLAFTSIAFVVIAHIGSAQSDQQFSGVWKLDPVGSDVRNLPAPPDSFLRVEQSAAALKVFASPDEGGPSTASIYPLDGRAGKWQVGQLSMNTMTKWEGSALLVNTLVSGPQNYTVMERWKLSRDGNTLTIKRTIVRLGGESESVLVYKSPNASVLSPARKVEDAPAATAPAEYVVETGTRVLMRLTNPVNTKHTVAGDRVYLETAMPLFVNGRLVIPRGSYVIGTVTDSQRAGRVKGKSALNLRFESLTLPNGVTRDLRSRPSQVDTKGDLDRSEGKIEGEGNKGGDARTVGKTTAAGAGIGTIAGGAAGHYGMGAGIGAAAGAAAGLAGVLSSRGPEVVLPAGTTMELKLDRDLRFTAVELGPGNER